MRKLLLGSCALLLTSAIAFGANVQLVPQGFIAEPSQIIPLVNALIQQINQNVSGLVAAQVGPVTSTATTAVQTLATTPIPSGTLQSSGQSLRLKCAGFTAANTNVKAVSLSFGSAVVTSGAINISGARWNLDLLITAVTPTANFVAIGGGQLTSTTISTPVAIVAQQVTSDNLATSLTASCQSQQSGAAGAAEVVMENFLVEQVK